MRSRRWPHMSPLVLGRDFLLVHVALELPEVWNNVGTSLPGDKMNQIRRPGSADSG